ncbi:cation diffusion facilitator family transporter [Guggenheimella bovis]
MNREKIAKQITIVSLLTNSVLALFKIIAGTIGHSSVVVADGIDSFSDLFTTLLAYIGVRISEKKEDSEHPYGHERFESIIGKLLALFLAGVAVTVAMKAYEELFSKEVAAPSTIAIVAAFVSIIGKFLLSRFVVKKAKLIESKSYEMDGKNYLNDTLTSFLSLTGAFLAQKGYPFFQPIFTFIIAFFILRIAIELYMNSVSELTDRSASEEDQALIQKIILSDPEVKRIDLLKTRMHGNRIYCDVEIAVESHLTLIEAHTIAERVHECIEAEHPKIKHIMVHVNPYQELD